MESSKIHSKFLRTYNVLLDKSLDWEKTIPELRQNPKIFMSYDAEIV